MDRDPRLPQNMTWTCGLETRVQVGAPLLRGVGREPSSGRVLTSDRGEGTEEVG